MENHPFSDAFLWGRHLELDMISLSSALSTAQRSGRRWSRVGWPSRDSELKQRKVCKLLEEGIYMVLRTSVFFVFREDYFFLKPRFLRQIHKKGPMKGWHFLGLLMYLKTSKNNLLLRSENNINTPGTPRSDVFWRLVHTTNPKTGLNSEFLLFIQSCKGFGEAN